MREFNFQVPLILAGTKGFDATAARPLFRPDELHLEIEFTIKNKSNTFYQHKNRGQSQVWVKTGVRVRF